MRTAIRWIVIGTAIAVLAAAAPAYLGWREWKNLEARAETFDLAELEQMPSVSEIFDANGNRYSRLDGEARYVVPLEEVSKSMIDALIAREDTRFFKHSGVDFQGIIRAAWKNFRADTVVEGASTLTQQLARNTFELGSDKWQRKLMEAALARRIEKQFSKQEILECYLNRIYFGEGVYGIETAARIYFGKSARALDLSESAMIAGLIRSPRWLSPLADPAVTLRERNVVLKRMEEEKMISPEEADAARRLEVPLSKRRMPEVLQDYAIDTVQRDLKLIFSEEQLQRGGLRIYTTLDPRLQKIAVDLIDEKLREVERQKQYPHPARPEAPTAEAESTASPYLQGALVAIDNRSGAIRAIVGGRDFQEDKYNRALLGRRQLGSTFKPFIYAAAYERGMLPSTPVDDSNLRAGEIDGAGENWDPENSDRESRGVRPADYGLVHSRNTMTIRIGNGVGLPPVRALGLRAGVAPEIPEVPAIYLGAFESTLREITGAYSIFPNQGIRRQNYIVERVEDAHGHLLYRSARIESRVLDETSSWLVHSALTDVMTKGTAARSRSLGFKLPAAGKTGTTDDFKDAWFIGYTADLTCGVWVGFDKPQRIINRGYGSTLALPIWTSFMARAMEREYAAKEFAFTGELTEARLCAVSNFLAHEGCGLAGTVANEKLPAKIIPGTACHLHDSMGLAVPPAIHSPQIDSSPEALVFAPRAVPTDQSAIDADLGNRALRATPVDPRGSVRVERKRRGFLIFHRDR